MAASPMNRPQTIFHARSNSLPSRPHPLFTQLDEHMRRVRDSQATSTSSSVDHKLSGLQDLYDCVDELLVLSLTQKSLLAHKGLDELLDGSLRFLDLCNIAKDALLQLKECALETQSIFCRRQGSGMSEIKKYLASRKVSRKVIQKALKNFKASSLENKSDFSSDDNEIVSILREVKATTLEVLKSLLSVVCGPKAQSKASHWSLVSKLVQRRKVRCQEEETNEFAIVDVAMESLVGCKTSKLGKSMLVENAQNHLKNLEMCIEDHEEGTECLFRRMIKTRVSLLNVFN